LAFTSSARSCMENDYKSLYVEPAAPAPARALLKTPNCRAPFSFYTSEGMVRVQCGGFHVTSLQFRVWSQVSASTKEPPKKGIGICYTDKHIKQSPAHLMYISLSLQFSIFEFSLCRRRLSHTLKSAPFCVFRKDNIAPTAPARGPSYFNFNYLISNEMEKNVWNT